MSDTAPLLLETLTAKDGGQTARINGRYLHSSRAPGGEADRFAQELSLAPETRIVVLVGSAVDTVAEAITARMPSICCLTVSPGDSSNAPPSAPQCRRIAISSGGQQARRTLRTLIQPLAAGSVELVVWPAAERVLPSWTDRICRGVSEALADLAAELATVGSTGRLWLRNALYWATVPDDRMTVTLNSAEVDLVAAGPSLEWAVPDQGVAAVVASSAERAWRARGGSVDVLAHTDAGTWSRRYLAGQSPGDSTPVLVSMRAATARLPRPVLTSSGWLGDALGADCGEWPYMPEAPTVAASMLRFARLQTSASVRLVGFDFCSWDLRGHARPHANDGYIARSARRCQPDETLQLGRAVGERGERIGTWPLGGSAWQTPHLSLFAATVAELSDSAGSVCVANASPVWQSARGCHDRRSPRGGGDARLVSATVHRRPSRSERRTHARAVLDTWQSQLGDYAPPSVWRNDGGARAELLLHLAAPAALAAGRGEGDWRGVGADAISAIERLRRWLDHV